MKFILIKILLILLAGHPIQLKELLLLQSTLEKIYQVVGGILILFLPILSHTLMLPWIIVRLSTHYQAVRAIILILTIGWIGL